MNKQISYITSAHLILAGIAVGYFFISKISTGSSVPGYEMSYDVPKAERTVVMSEKAAKGKTLFQSKCASCHSLFKTIVGPRLIDALEREPWSDRKELYKWIRSPEGFMKTNSYTRELKKTYGSIMTAFPDMTDEEIDSIVEYITAVTPL